MFIPSNTLDFLSVTAPAMGILAVASSDDLEYSEINDGSVQVNFNSTRSAS